MKYRPSFVGVRSVKANDDWSINVDTVEGFDDAVRYFFTSGNATEDVDEDRFDFRIVVDDLESVLDWIWLDAARPKLDEYTGRTQAGGSQSCGPARRSTQRAPGAREI